MPDFRSPEFLRSHVLQTMAFYDGRCLDASGGFFQAFRDDGSVYDPRTRHLVGSARFVITHAMAARAFADHARAGAWHEAAAHGLRFLDTAHRDPVQGGYHWLLDWDGRDATVRDATKHCYGLAFVLLAHAQALRIDVPGAADGLHATFELMERHFWEPDAQLYADEASADWQLSPYRGQNANMHACEAMLAAFDATGERHWLQRAGQIAEAVTLRLAQQADGLIWEHYDKHWRIDRDYHRDDPANLFRPWGFQTGHLTEWAKLLLTLEARAPDASTGLDRIGRAQRLFDAAWREGWDAEHGGLVYGFAEAPAGGYAVCDAHKYYWVQSESFAAAARLQAWQHYDRLWAHAWSHFVDHRYGAWYRILSSDNRKLSDQKSPPGKTDYHTIGACLDVLEAMGPTR
ncbi:AGE family epimerase/isomerase [Aquincola sp. S2]|uniref:AGE family epimerase/isomerase n=1 Tax=Pseudaquabacterium terrae TaxID=2732868 RepID=A0ABX2EKG4_9BURK|nr:AGE family epimerase/isomerase [Aquabacterium terrae]NRF69139.1 AGE family epimerase/isomerase [Aquabacterium terrae]